MLRKGENSNFSFKVEYSAPKERNHCLREPEEFLNKDII